MGAEAVLLMGPCLALSTLRVPQSRDPPDCKQVWFSGSSCEWAEVGWSGYLLRGQEEAGGVLLPLLSGPGSRVTVMFGGWERQSQRCQNKHEAVGQRRILRHLVWLGRGRLF